MNIENYGWNEFFQKEWHEKATGEMFPGRVITDHGTQLRVMTERGEMVVNRPVSPKPETAQIGVGDWLALETGGAKGQPEILFVLSRKTKFSRTAAGIELKEQIVAANVDTVFLIQSLNRDFNLKRLERYLIAAWESGANPVVVLTKADASQRVEEMKEAVYARMPGVAVHAVSSLTGAGIEALQAYLVPGKTVALLGSSGVGKSTLVNTLAGMPLMEVQAIREQDGRGRHTTTHRELVLLPKGGLVLDTPGMRTLFLWEADTGMERVYGDVEELASQCRFHDCQHQTEPGCAVRAAREAGTLSEARWQNWEKLRREQQHLEARKDQKLRLLEKQTQKKQGKLIKEIQKKKW